VWLFEAAESVDLEAPPVVSGSRLTLEVHAYERRCSETP
jgi:hypothetical protein